VADRRRWDNDERGRGVGDGRRLEPGAVELADALREPDWVAEQPEAHLLPHLRRACERGAVGLRLDGTRTEPDGAFVVELHWPGPRGDVRSLQAAAYALIGEVAESATYIRQRREAEATVYEVGTGMLAPDTTFAPHGHVLVLRVTQ
jgi:hypothetical protein